MSFSEAIYEFNIMYRLPVPSSPSLSHVGDVVTRLKNFKKILGEELDEIDGIISKVETMVPYTQNVDVLTDLADLLGDIMVYCGSEMAKFGIPQDEVLSLIMSSNFSKLGEDGQPIYDERGKVQKGPGYWKPEPEIRNLLIRKGAKG